MRSLYRTLGLVLAVIQILPGAESMVLRRHSVAGTSAKYVAGTEPVRLAARPYYSAHRYSADKLDRLCKTVALGRSKFIDMCNSMQGL
ncbi:hypothetical protein AAVH_07280 [Aphelenchoides avenae]|nr:hypothetical protein AAVH_07280 [Aphelenchus avenae]